MICSPCNLSTESSVRPLRPIKCIMGVQDHDGWKNLRGVPIEALDIDDRELADSDDEVNAESGEVARVPQGLREPSEPTAAMRARHNLTHWPLCLRLLPDGDCRDKDLVSCFVGTMYPSRNIFDSIVGCKGSGDKLAVKAC